MTSNLRSATVAFTTELDTLIPYLLLVAVILIALVKSSVLNIVYKVVVVVVVPVVYVSYVIVNVHARYLVHNVSCYCSTLCRMHSIFR